MERFVAIVLEIVAAYAALGLLVAIALHARGLARIDPVTRGGGVTFRALITPGLVALWPLFVARWRAARRGAPRAGGVHRPLTAERLRLLHRRLAFGLALVVPLFAGVGIALRPGRPTVDRAAGRLLAEPAPLGERLATHERPFGALPVRLLVRGAGTDERQLELAVERDLEIPELLLYWTADEAAFPAGARFLGAVWGPGQRRFAVERAMTERGSLVLYSLGWQRRVASFRLHPE